MAAENTQSLELEAIDKVLKQVEAFKKDLGAKADKDQFDNFAKDIAALKDVVTEGKTASAEEVRKIKLQLEEMSEDVAKTKENGARKQQPRSIGQMFIDKLITDKFDLTSVAQSKGARRYNVSLDGMISNKTVANMTTSRVDAVGTASIPYELADFEFGLTRIARRSPFLIQLANTSPISTMYAQWAEQETPEGAPLAVAEGNAKPQIDFDWVEKSQKVEKIAAYIKISKEMLADLPGIRNEIDTELQETVLLKADEDLWDANGTSPNIKGITAYATAFSMPSGLSADVDNKADLLRAAIAQVEANKFTPNYIVMHPTDIAAMDIDKDSEGRYLLTPFRSADGMTISGIPIVTNLGVDQDKFLVGDFTKWRVRIREGFNIDVGLDGNDFTNNLVTILGEIRLVSYVKANHAGAFVYGDFSNVLGS